MLTRRHFLLGSGAAALGAAARVPAALAASTATLAIETRQIEVNGKAAKAFALLGPDGQEGLRFRAGDEFAVTLQNRTSVPSLIHWHGLTPPFQQDGVPDVSQPALEAGGSYDYRFPLHRPGTYWMHSHQGLQEQQLAAAPLIIQDPAEAALDRQEVVILLHDFSFRDPDEILADLRKGGGGGMAGMNMGDMSTHAGMSGMDISGGGMGGMKPDFNDVTYDAFLANGRTLEDPEIFAVEKGGRVRLRIINGAASTNFTIDTGALGASLIAVDGQGIEPVGGSRFPIAIAQRLDVVVELPPAGGVFSILALQEGTTARTGVILSSARSTVARISSAGEAAGPVVGVELEARLRSLRPLPARNADRRIDLKLEGDMQRYLWTFDGIPHMRHPPLRLKQGERVELSYRNTTMMSHPIHLHGHSFQVVGIGGKRLDGAVRDTVLVPPMGTVDVAFDADNPGKWVMHCHQLYHMVSGMMVEPHYEGFA
jgi:FtsP/CotA-like multicopper oxidase with cupredoxin domain